MVVSPDFDARPNEDDGLPSTKQASNKKKAALKAVLAKLKSAETDLGADKTGEAAKSSTLTQNLGGSGKLWTSPLADKMRDQISGSVTSITSSVTTAREDVSDDWEAEPDSVDPSDPRANWG